MTPVEASKIAWDIMKEKVNYATFLDVYEQENDTFEEVI